MIKFTFDTLQAKAYVQTLPQKIRDNLKVRMDEAINIFECDLIDGLYGKILHVRTGLLMGSMKRQVMQTATSTIGIAGSSTGAKGVKYAPIHEYGGMAGRGRKVKIPARHYVSIPWIRNRQAMLDRLGLAFKDAVHS